MSKQELAITLVILSVMGWCVYWLGFHKSAPEQPTKKWYGYYCTDETHKVCEYRDDYGNRCPIQVPRDTWGNHYGGRLVEGSCKIQ